MAATATLATTLIVAFVFAVALSAWFLQFSARLTKANPVSYGRALVAMALVGVYGLVCAFAALWLPISAVARGLSLAALILVGSWGIIQRTVGGSFWRGVQVWSLSLLAAVGSVMAVASVSSPFLVRAYKIPTNAMAPTILGAHFKSKRPADRVFKLSGLRPDSV